MRIEQRRIGVFFLLAAMALAPGVTLGQNAGGSAGQSAASSPLSPELVAKIKNLVFSPGIGIDHDIPADLVEPLDLAPAGNIWMEREVDFKYAKDLHSFGFGRGTDANNQDLLLGVLYEGDAILIFRAHSDGTLVSAIRADIKTHQVRTLTLAEAQPTFATECALWRDHIDKLIADASKASPNK